MPADDLPDLVAAGCTETEILQVMGDHPLAPVRNWRASGQQGRAELFRGTAPARNDANERLDLTGCSACRHAPAILGAV